MHDLFPYAPRDPSWLLYVSLASFRNTRFQKSMGSVFGAYELGRELIRTTEIDPATDAETLLVTAENIFDWRSFRVLTTYDSGEDNVKRSLEKIRKENPSFRIQELRTGWEAWVPGRFRWHLVGMGRVLAVTYEPPVRKGSTEHTKLPDNPFDSSDSGMEDAGAKSVDSAAGPDSFPEWPSQVNCLVQPKTESKNRSDATNDRVPLTGLARSMLRPAADRRYPVAVLTTRDPRAVGLGRRFSALRFQYAAIRVFFGDDVRLEGNLRFAGEEATVSLLAAAWRSMARSAARDPLLSMAGLSRLFDGLTLTAKGSEIDFTLHMTEGQANAALIFLELQGEALERQLRDKSWTPNRR
jgi:hypothetical protein